MAHGGFYSLTQPTGSRTSWPMMAQFWRQAASGPLAAHLETLLAAGGC
jgi:hypothetical protein